MLYLIDKADPSNADGTIDKEEMLEILHDAASLKTARLANSAEMEIKNQSPKMQEVLSTFDADGSNSCLFDERVGGWVGGGCPPVSS